MRDDFCAFILTHGRPDKVLTYRTLRRAGYTGKIFIVVDDEDKTRNQYMAEFGEQVLVFSKADIASRFDEADNFCDRRSIFYARNACFDLAKLVGCKYFIQLDDDYHEFQFRVDRNYDQAYFPIRKLDAILSEMLAYYESIPALSIAMSQGGDFLGDNGGHASWVKRKAMNSFICSVDRPFSFMGRINEDVNTYTNLGRCGELFMTIGAVQLAQLPRQRRQQILRRRPKRPRRTPGLLKRQRDRVPQLRQAQKQRLRRLPAPRQQVPGRPQPVPPPPENRQKAPHHPLQQPQRRLAKPLSRPAQQRGQLPQRRHPKRTRKRRKPVQNPQKRLLHRPPVRRRHRHHLRLLQKMRRADRHQQRKAAPRRHPRRRQRQLAVRRRQLRAKVRRNPRQRALRQRQNGQRILHPPWRLRMRARRKRG